MAIELVTETPLRIRWQSLFRLEGSRIYRGKCDVCGQSSESITLTYHRYSYEERAPYILAELLGFKVVGYGKYNQRHILFCPTHKDAEIEAIIKGLA